MSTTVPVMPPRDPSQKPVRGLAPPAENSDGFTSGTVLADTVPEQTVLPPNLPATSLIRSSKRRHTQPHLGKASSSSLSYLWDRVSSPGCALALPVAEDDPERPIFLPPSL